MVSFVVPCLDEEANVEKTVASIERVTARIPGLDYEIILVNDGSTDSTGQIIDRLAAENPRVQAIHHDVNRGLGRSIIDGVERSTKAKFLVVPGDNDVSYQSLLLMLHFRDHAEIILTNPLNREIRPLARQLVSIVYQFAHNLLFGTAVGYLNGPGIWPTEQVKLIDLQSNRFSIIAEMNVKLLTQGISFAEVPIYLQADPPKRRTITWRNLKEVLKIYFYLVGKFYIGRDRPQIRPLNRHQIDFSALVDIDEPAPAPVPDPVGGALPDRNPAPIPSDRTV